MSTVTQPPATPPAEAALAAPAPAATPTDELIVDVRGLKMYFPVLRGLLRRKVADVKAVDDVSFQVRKGEILGLVGESGCGKTTVGRCVMGLHKASAGSIVFEGREIVGLPERKMKAIRRKMAYIFQDPYSSLDPRQSAASIVGEPLIVQKTVAGKAARREKVDELLTTVGIDPAMRGHYPHEFSGGQRQRIGIARALACDPDLLILDEPISALDVSIQAQVINLLKELQQRYAGLSYIFVAHDLAVVRHISDRIAVMYLGHIVETGPGREICDAPIHPYTRALLSAVPVPDAEIEAGRERMILPGEVPSPLNPPPGCTFHERCFMAAPECSQTVPPLRQVGEGREVACLRV